MHVTAHLDLDVVALDQEHEVTVLVEVTAPGLDADAGRPVATVQVVLDRSGSMEGARLEGARRALLGLVDRLDPRDNFGVVSFDDSARVEVAAGPVSDKKGAREAVRRLRSGGSTDLSSGLLRGVQEARRAAGGGGATLLLISDGHANLGVVEPELLGRVAKEAHRHGVSVTTLGYGLDYDERLMTAIADGGAGSALHAEDPDAAGVLIAGEVDGLLSKVTQAASLTVTPRGPVTSVLVYGGLPVTRQAGGGIMAELGDLYAGETRGVLLRLLVPGIARLGPATLAELVFTYVEAATLTTYTVTVPVAVDVVPGDEAAGQVPDLTVRAERLFQEAQDAKRRAAEALLSGDVTEAAEVLRSAGDELEKGLLWAPNAEELSREVRELRRYATESARDGRRVSKEALASWHRRTRKRGRDVPGMDVPGMDDPPGDRPTA